MINKYMELHGELIELLVKYHNAHMTFVNSPGTYNLTPVFKITNKILRQIRAMKKYDKELRPWLREEKKKRIEEKIAKKEARKNERLNRSNESGA
jgi:hypothetical protein